MEVFYMCDGRTLCRLNRTTCILSSDCCDKRWAEGLRLPPLRRNIVNVRQSLLFFLPPAASEKPANNSSCYSMCGHSATVLLFILGEAADIQNRPQNPACFTVHIGFLSGALLGFKCSV